MMEYLTLMISKAINWILKQKKVVLTSQLKVRSLAHSIHQFQISKIVLEIYSKNKLKFIQGIII